jgi:GNAT superfamily N-acetyltransferase
MYVCKATLADIPQLLYIQEHCYPKDLHETYENYASIISHSDFCFVLMEKYIIIGYVLAHLWDDVNNPPQLHRNLSDINEPTCLFIHDMAILPAFQRKNLGRMLLKKIKDELTLEIPCTLCAVHGAEHYWARLGFEKMQCPDTILKSYCNETQYMFAKSIIL